jgi:hypothetical protein
MAERHPLMMLFSKFQFEGFLHDAPKNLMLRKRGEGKIGREACSGGG